MTPALRRAALVAAVVVALVIAGLVSIAAIREGDDSGSARKVAERYLEVLSDETQDVGELDDLVSSGDPEALERAGALLASARMRIGEPTLGEAEELDIADRASALGADDDASFERFERFEVTYSLGGEQHSAAVTLGLLSSGTDQDWRVVRPLSGQVNWNAATWEQTLLGLRVGDVEVTDPDRTTFDLNAQFVHPGIYPVEAYSGRWYSSPRST